MSEPSSEAVEQDPTSDPGSVSQPPEERRPESEPSQHGAADGHGDEHHDGNAYPYVQHHFDSPQQQFEAGKLGIWLFLVTEVLFFAGLFCAYTIYRSQHPEVFSYAHYYLDTNLGALNTIVLIFSSLTAAWAVRNAQLGQKKALIANIVITIACACTFMLVKYFEYSHKFHDGLLPGKRFQPVEEVWELEGFKQKHPEAAAAMAAMERKLEAHRKRAEGATAEKPAAGAADGAAREAAAPASGEPAVAQGAEGEGLDEQVYLASMIRKLSKAEAKPLVDAGILRSPSEGRLELNRPDRVHIFFGIYFFMTGLHGFHVLAGIAVWVWLLVRATKGQFGALYFGPIDFAALYWHLVDLIWIYLFPLLYLIH
jgi:cytochrome c oxidase subunit 3